MGPEQTARYLRRQGLTPRKGRSQNHLVDQQVLDDIIALASPAPTRRVLEIGPGLGVLTAALLDRGASVVAVEVDSRLADHLRGRFEREIGAGSLRLVEADVLDTPMTDLVDPNVPYDLVANLPYHITSPVMHHVLRAEPRPLRFVVMLQREVAERIAAPPGQMSYLSVFVQYHAAVRVARIVPASAFEPAPGVQSAVLVGETRPRVLGEEAEEGLWRLVQAGFRERRKMLHNVLPRQLPQVGRERFEAALATVGIASDRRPQTVSVDEWLALAAAVGPARLMHASPRAKVNLTLCVGPRGDDGYHPLSSVFLRVGLADELVVAPAPGPGGDVLTVTGLPGAPVESNLVLRAFALTRRALGQDLPGLVAHLEKRIPMGAGLGGGSSDAAAAVDGALVVWGAGLAPDVRAEIDLGLGADVPFFARGGEVALVEGRGEQVERLAPPNGGLSVLLVTPPLGLSTSQVFARFDDLGTATMSETVTRDLATALRDGMSAARLVAWAARLRDANDLWPAAASLAPGLAALREQLEAQTNRPWLLTGSGSTLFALYPSVAEATAEGRLLVQAESELLEGAMINAVDLVGPDPAWRFP